MNNLAVVVPLKNFDRAKHRLRQGGTNDVTALAEDLALGVLRSAAPHHIIVLSESAAISSFAHRHEVEVIESTATSLNDAVQGAYAFLGDRYEQLIIVHGDLRHPEGLGSFVPDEGVTIVTDHHAVGTNVLVVPTRIGFHFAYGPDSSRHHQREALRLGVAYQVITDSPWRFDVDEPADLLEPE